MSYKIKCVSLTTGMIESNKYPSPKGNTYEFFRNQFTDVKDAEDALYFLSTGNGEFFEVDGNQTKIKKELAELCDKINKAKDEEPTEPKEEEKTEPEPVDTVVADGETVPIDDTEETEKVPERTPEEIKEGQEEAKESEEKIAEEEKPEPEEKITEPEETLITEEGLKGLVRAQQEYLIRKIQGETTEIPRYENERVTLLVKLQKEGNDLINLLKGFNG